MKKKAVTAVLLLLLTLTFSACGGRSAVETEPDTTTDEKLISVGFSQLGAESDWRNANTESIRNALSEENGFSLNYKNGLQKQSNQIKALRTFIQQEVDYIVLAPSTEEGWDTVLAEAKNAGIPVILVDRQVNGDKDLYTSWVGSDFELEGRRMTTWIYNYTHAKGIDQKDIHIVDLQGSIGSSAQIGRTKSLDVAVKQYGWDLLAKESADFTENKGREVMASLLRKYDNINVVYCENDNEAIGAIDAIEAAGKKPGSDILNGEIMVVSFDGINRDALEYARNGKISCIAECNPYQGQYVRNIIERLEKGEKPVKNKYVSEGLQSSIPDVQTVTVNNERIGVTLLR
ncbi:MAG: ABC transporter substrate-binding protein [Clostridiales bacterium]|nr:ABC transporter substrate-binding protein [Clostridiales bacterium]